MSAVADPRRLATEIRSRLGPAPRNGEWPLVSMVVPNRDGAAMLGRLIAGLTERTDYPAFELIVVDNASGDDSLELLRRIEAPFSISILANHHNESFSDSCNQGAEVAAGDVLLFLNNDVEPFEPGWLRELVACWRSRQAGAVAATLVCPDEEHDRGFAHGYGVQHRGLAFREEEGMVVPVLHGWEADPLDGELGEDLERGAVAAACLLIGRQDLERVEGFSHGYVYGVEDVDLCMKLRSAELPVFCCGCSIAIHHPVSTRRKTPFEEERARKLANRCVLWERWGPRLRREFELDRLDGRGLWAAGSATAGDGRSDRGASPSDRARIEALGICIKAADPATALALGMVAAALERRGHRSVALLGERAEDPVGLNYDVAVHVRGAARYVPKPGQFNVFWDRGGAGPLAESMDRRYDIDIAFGASPPDLEARGLLTSIRGAEERAGSERWFAS